MPSNKDKIIAAAMELFHEQGFQATGLEEILSRCGVVKSNFYYHFKSKEELGRQVIQQKIALMEEQIFGPSLDNRALGPKERLGRLFRLMQAAAEEHDCRRGCYIGNLVLELGDRYEELRRLLVDFLEDIENRIEACLQEGAANQEINLHGMKARETAVALTALLQGGMLLGKAHRSSLALQYGGKLVKHIIGNGLEGEQHAG
ncbi:TetR/AcrR family transcriptional regulator [Paenibacillus chitinolyticus]|uniref:TetR/AcrR family transcriptional regulator n=1 Tax=Paenibacillus chitinolyticus TaxID=79263 RepID=UPI002DB6454C|nr:TetR/AcrR family transcriptional regulator [Paenibacillus chitinolyticus]MEC0248825.1 TetR/AcrR family transcriptional regulator [Paenibacillus chitinolyticus]